MTNNLARKHLDKRLDHWRPVSEFPRPPRGWLRAIREALGMTTGQFAQRLGVSQPRIPALEQGEIDGSVTIATLERAAQALDCTFVYALVPRQPLDTLVQERARAVASQQIARTDHTMRLENQAVEPDDLASERDQLIRDLIARPRRMWDQP